jgi:DNA topoisomerase-1
VIDDRKVNAQQARRILDRLVGYKASPILWRSIKTGLSAGRVQTVALRLIVEREREIRAFTPQEYWSIDALCAKDGQTFEASLAKVGGHKPQLHSAEDAQAVVDAVRQLPFVVSKVEKRNRRKNPGAPFTTSTRSRRPPSSGFIAARCRRRRISTRVWRRRRRAIGLITYMRTDSVRSVGQRRVGARLHRRELKKPYLPDAPNA